VWFHYYVLAIPAVILAVSLAFQAGNSAMQATAPRVLALIGLLCMIRFPAELLPLPLVVQVLTLNIGVILISLQIAYALLTRDKDCHVAVSESVAV